MFKQEFILLIYNKDITCVVDQGQDPVCKVIPRIKRRTIGNKEPSHDPYIPRNNSILFNCSTECHLIAFKSMIELTSPNLFLKSCFIEFTKDDSYACETIRYNYLKNIDKLLFLSNTVANKTFYLVDCLIYKDGGRVCHKNDHGDIALGKHIKLIDTGTLARPNETNILSQDEFICEESIVKEINCDLNPFVPFENGLKLKESIKFVDSVLLKTDSYIVELSRVCVDSWCGYSGHVEPTRRQYSYRPPGGKVFRCYYAKKQQVCKMVGDPSRLVYNQRGWLDGN